MSRRKCAPAVALVDHVLPVSYTHLDVYKRQAADDAQTDENIFVFPTAIPEGGAPTGPVYEDLPEDIWAES